jgi:hypothetical protein
MFNGYEGASEVEQVVELPRPAANLIQERYAMLKNNAL